MSLSIKYIPIYSKNIEAEVQFFIQYFNLTYAGKMQLTVDVEGILLKLDANKELYFLIIPSGITADDLNHSEAFKIIIHTNDCLKEYLFMKERGIEFDERPQHRSLGLAACFKLADGSQYMLLEERNYNELFI
jgi:hypothetical protein